MTAPIYYSVRTRQALATGMTSVPLGFAHYSYALVCAKFLQALGEDGWAVHELARPEIYPSARHLPASSDRQPIHLIFKPFDEIRVVKGARNIAVVFWEFDRLPVLSRLPIGHPKRANILNDYVHCLGLVDEVWVGCEFSRAVLEREGVRNVAVVPTPIATPGSRPAAAVQPGTPIEMTECSASALRRAGTGRQQLRPAESLFLRLRDAKARGGRVLLSIFNPGDPRKNPGAMMLGFQASRRQHPADLLVIKLVMDGRYGTLSSVIRTELPTRFRENVLSFGLLDSPNILLVAGRLSEADMAQLRQISDFYLCTSSAEGQNLPLLEGMAEGVVPISPGTTAMRDYLGTSSAFLIPTVPLPVHDRLASAYGMQDARWDVTDPQSVSATVDAALAATPHELAAKREAGRHTVADRYSYPAITRLVGQRLGRPPAAILAEAS